MSFRLAPFTRVRHRPMLRMVAIAGLGGVALSVLVALGLSLRPKLGNLFSSPDPTTTADRVTGLLLDVQPARKRFGVDHWDVTVRGTLNGTDTAHLRDTRSMANASTLMGLTSSISTRCIVAAGWPLRSLWGAVDFPESRLSKPQERGPKLVRAVQIRGLHPSSLHPVEGVLPIGVLPVGAFVNSLFFAGCVLATRCAFWSARRAMRVRRGFCASCGYDMRGGPSGCPECGATREL